MMPSEMYFSLALYGPWHIDDLYKLKIDQLYFGFPCPDFLCVFGTKSCMFLICTFLNHSLHNYVMKKTCFWC